jgi:hypothetical protein
LVCSRRGVGRFLLLSTVIQYRFLVYSCTLVMSKATDGPQGLSPIVVDLIGGFKVNAGYVICSGVTADPTVVFGDSSD